MSISGRGVLQQCLEVEEEIALDLGRGRGFKQPGSGPDQAKFAQASLHSANSGDSLSERLVHRPETLRNLGWR